VGSRVRFDVVVMCEDRIGRGVVAAVRPEFSSRKSDLRVSRGIFVGCTVVGSADYLDVSSRCKQDAEV
jgi:hypothetical protein